jgi:hypothetical protein
MKPCSCGHWYAKCSICGRPGTALEYLALTAGVTAEQLRDHLRAEIDARATNEPKRSDTDGRA